MRNWRLEESFPKGEMQIHHNAFPAFPPARQIHNKSFHAINQDKGEARCERFSSCTRITGQEGSKLFGDITPALIMAHTCSLIGEVANLICVSPWPYYVGDWGRKDSPRSGAKQAEISTSHPWVGRLWLVICTSKRWRSKSMWEGKAARI